MSIRTAKLSPAALETIQSQLSNLSVRSEAVQPDLALLAGAAAERNLQTAAAHDVYNLPLTALAGSSGPEAATSVGVRCLITSGDKPIATVELPEPNGNEGAITSHGPFTQGTVDAIRAAEDSSDVAEGDFELRLLRIPALYLMTLWLKDEDDDRDLFVPLEPAPPHVSPGRTYTWQELSECLRPLAQERLEAKDVDEAGPTAPA
ncbi:MAG TPA: hypothetical protein VNO20_02880 [Solirubrobacterales bacterium]|nr:hypothetical protein [Solirubrobacterales bacterium]